MQFLLSHIESVVTGYTGNPPLAVFLKNYFRQYPKLGSRDRKAISEAAFIYYRCALTLGKDKPVLQVVKAGMAYCKSGNAFLERVLSDVENMKADNPELNFPLDLSSGITAEEWLRSLWHQPRLFIRIRKNMDRIVALLEKNELSFRAVPTGPDTMDVDCLSLKNGSAIDRLLPEESYVVQDWASQASLQLALSVMKKHDFLPRKVWDVCSGAGGKSILLKDKIPEFRLLASDIRESILHNLKMRFKKYHFTGFETRVMDSTVSADLAAQLSGKQFDAVICDVPCSGSGTWARTPEQFHFFEPAQLQKFEALQYPIAFNAQHYLKPGGFFVYITCSVFAAENETVVDRLLKNTDLSLLYSQVINGIDKEADCMFVAIFRK
jgi:16S rRNA (cytosine967-C5)-methyltransferase